MADAIRRHRQDWNDLAEFDAYWAVLTRRDRKYGRWDRLEFFATGEAEVAAMLDRCGDLGRPGGFGRALDYCCGLGRLSRALPAASASASVWTFPRGWWSVRAS